MSCNITETPSLEPIKQGDTFLLMCRYEEDGSPIPLDPYDISSSVRDSLGALIQNLTVEKLTDVGVFSLSAGPTTAWPIDQLSCDIKFVDSSLGIIIRHSDLFKIPVVPAVTE